MYRQSTISHAIVRRHMLPRNVDVVAILGLDDLDQSVKAAHCDARVVSAQRIAERGKVLDLNKRA